MTTAPYDDDRRHAGPYLNTFLDALGRVTGKTPRRVGKEWRALCPVPSHGDTNESLDVTAGDRQPVVAICRSYGCDWDTILGALGFDAPRRTPAHRPAVRPAAPAKTSTSGELDRVAAEYRYVDAAGELLYVVTRFDPKGFRQKRADPEEPGRWRWNLDGVRRVPYRLPELTSAIAAGQTVYLVEGEKDADTLAGLGLPATAHAQGAKNWRAESAEFFAGAHVVVIPDNDGEGRARADAACADLVTKNVVVSPVSDLANPAKWSMTAFGAAARTEVVRSAADHIRAVQTLPRRCPSAT